MIVDPSADSDPVTATYSWTALDNATFGDQSITYTVIVTYENDTVVAGQSTTHPNSSLEISDLPACANLTATLVAERNNESSNGTVEQFSTSEPSGESVSCACIIAEEEWPLSTIFQSNWCGPNQCSSRLHDVRLSGYQVFLFYLGNISQWLL